MKYCIHNTRLIIGIADRVIENGSILFDQDKILKVSAHSITDADVFIDGTTFSVLPGLIDVHVHLGMDCSVDPFDTMEDTEDAFTSFIAYKQGLQFLRAGITTVRNLGTKNNVDIIYKKAVESGLVIGPRVYAAGQPLIMTGGHGQPMGTEVDGKDEVIKATRQRIKEGADLIKIMATGGVLTKGNHPGAVHFNVDELKCICQEAAKASLTTAAHAIGLNGVKNAIKAGVNTIEHGYYLDKETVDTMRDLGIYLTPTLLAPTLLQKNSEHIPQHMIDKIEEIEKEHRKSFRLALERGVKIIAGTDAGTPFNNPGQLVEELKIMLEEGMTTAQAIESATYLGAKCLKVDSLIGSLEEQKLADLIVVKGNPLEDIRNLKNIQHVFKGGVRLYPDQIH
ncbi:amidohydrolase family protein [Halalkalibacterium halodurans]|jgi:imidazolonepropionase-like amidohydrolase|uniref:metal-dependent hydrolase family protein n=2 Tax=Halalkalibacterium halodurans TaxID=86665 RepID=UPI002E1B15EF|nr:amidohydrolase family protein [Halalkalibacterium halodurans]